MPVSTGSLCGPVGVAADSSANVYVTSKSENRLLKYVTPLTTNTVADLVLGQPDFSHSSPDTADASGQNEPIGMAIDRKSTPNHLYVADTP